MSAKNVWREFERLVAKIEAAASPRGARVASPDRVRDLTTGRMREVDASIRYRVGTVDVLITVECRRRNRKGDDTWIEQLATKRLKIGASKTIAVSATGFTSSAKQSASSLGVELRVLSEVSAADVEDWFLAGGAIHVFRSIENVRCTVNLYEDSGEPSKYVFDLPDVDLPMFFGKSGVLSSPFAIREYVPALESYCPEKFVDIPLDGTTVDLEFPIEWEPGELQIATTDDEMLSVHLTILRLSASYQSAVCDIGSGTHHEYVGPDGVKIQRTSFKSELVGRPVTFEHQGDAEGNQIVSYRFDDELGKRR